MAELKAEDVTKAGRFADGLGGGSQRAQGGAICDRQGGECSNQAQEGALSARQGGTSPGHDEAYKADEDFSEDQAQGAVGDQRQSSGEV